MIARYTQGKERAELQVTQFETSQILYLEKLDDLVLIPF